MVIGTGSTAATAGAQAMPSARAKANAINISLFTICPPFYIVIVLMANKLYVSEYKENKTDCGMAVTI